MIILEYILLVIAVFLTIFYLLQFLVIIIEYTYAAKHKRSFKVDIKVFWLLIAVMAWTALIVFF